MKKSSFLILILAVAVMVMGAGYAYWTETLTIDNTVKTGMLDFTFENSSISDKSDYVSDSSSCIVNSNDNQVDVELVDMYPGANATLKFDLKNTGTMKAKVKNFLVSVFSEKPYFECTSLKIDGGTNELSAPVDLDTLASTLDGLGVEIEPNASVTFEIALGILSSATEAEIAENLGNGGGSPISFNITADGLQYNDDVN